MEICTWVCGLKTKLMEKEYTFMQMDRNTKVIGLWIRSMGKARNVGLMVLYLKEIMLMVTNMVRVSLSGQMVRVT